MGVREQTWVALNLTTFINLFLIRSSELKLLALPLSWQGRYNNHLSMTSQSRDQWTILEDLTRDEASELLFGESANSQAYLAVRSDVDHYIRTFAASSHDGWDQNAAQWSLGKPARVAETITAWLGGTCQRCQEGLFSAAWEDIGNLRWDREEDRPILLLNRDLRTQASLLEDLYQIWSARYVQTISDLAEAERESEEGVCMADSEQPDQYSASRY